MENEKRTPFLPESGAPPPQNTTRKVRKVRLSGEDEGGGGQERKIGGGERGFLFLLPVSFQADERWQSSRKLWKLCSAVSGSLKVSKQF